MLVSTAHAVDVRVVTIGPVEDMSLPFWCDWGYDWEERCYRDDSDRLGVGGVDDKVWRAALHFSLDALPPQATDGPIFASSSYADPALRPRLTVWYLAG